MTEPNLSELLAGLCQAKVEFVLVGGLAGVAQGAPVTTFDVDIVHLRTAENVDRLLGFLHSVHAFVREPSERRLLPSRAALLGPGHVLLRTDLGPLDCLGVIENGLDFAALRPQSREITLRGQTLLVLGLATLVRLKEQWPDEESRLRALLLRRALEK